MQTQIFLIAPTDAEAAAFSGQLSAVLSAQPVSALLLPRGSRAENAYKDFCKAIIPIAQARQCAVLLEGSPGLVRMLGADGLHVATGLADAQDAIAALRPELIVGVGPVESRDDAMSIGELEPDYLLFGAFAGPVPAAQRDMAAWWAQTMEIPAVLADPAASLADHDAAGCEFIGLAMPALELAR